MSDNLFNVSLLYVVSIFCYDILDAVTYVGLPCLCYAVECLNMPISFLYLCIVFLTIVLCQLPNCLPQLLN
jgi:uncharacterized membrane protein YhdT